VLFRSQTFPETIVSFGGHQSNAMLAIATAVNNSHPGSRFIYFTKKVPSYLKASYSGSLYQAMNLGMEIRELTTNEYSQLVESPLLSMPPQYPFLQIPPDAYWIPQGGAYADAELGVSHLAEELLGDIEAIGGCNGRWKVVIASGTGTSALFLARRLHLLSKQSSNNKHKDFSIEVVAVPCVGSADYLRLQMERLDSYSGNFAIFPTIISPEKTHAFATPCDEHMSIWKELCGCTGVEFDLVYAPRAWEVLRDSWSSQSNLWVESSVIYVHCGGVEGNKSQLGRYRHLGLLS